MTAPTPDWWPLLVALRDCLCHNLSLTVEGAPARCCIVAGSAVAMDDCCQGTAWVRIATIDGADADSFPNPSPLPLGPCTNRVAAITVGLGVVRCAHTIDESGTAPNCEQMESDALAQASDIDALYRTAQCCTAAQLLYDASTIGDYTPAGPQGGCVGGELQVVYGIDMCPCEP